MRLTKGILVLLSGLLLSSAIVAQSADDSQYNYVRVEKSQSFNSSSTILSLGFGFGGYYPYAGASYVENPNVTLSGEHTIFKHAGPGYIDLGAIFSYKSIYSGYTDYYTNYSYEQRWNYYISGTRLSYHITPFRNRGVELYAGVMVAYYITTFHFSSNDPNYDEPSDPGYSLKFSNTANFFAPSVYTGVRSWITSRSSVWIEVGYGYASLAFGASYRI